MGQAHGSVGGPDGGFDEDAVRNAVAEALQALDPRSVAGEMTAGIEAEIPELRGDADIHGALAASVAGNVDTVLHAIALHVAPSTVEPPLAAMEYPRRLAQRGLPVTALVRAYRIGQGVMLGLMLGALRSAPLSAALNLAAHDWVTRWSFSYSDAVIEQVIDAYQRERDGWIQGRSGARVMRIRELLGGDGEVDVDVASVSIGYPLRRRHLAVVAWLPGDERGDDTADLIAGLVREFSAVVDAPLFIAADRRAVHGWLPVPAGRSTVPGVRELAERLAAGPGRPRFALGTVGAGVEGFRRSHREAIAARRVAGESAVVDAADPGVLLLALVGSDTGAARRWAEAVLGPLASDTESDARLRGTLEAFLRAGGSHKAAAAELMLHPNSVKYRVQRAVQRRGREIGADRLDVEVALRVLTCVDIPD